MVTFFPAQVLLCQLSEMKVILYCHQLKKKPTFSTTMVSWSSRATNLVNLCEFFFSLLLSSGSSCAFCTSYLKMCCFTVPAFRTMRENSYSAKGLIFKYKIKLEYLKVFSLFHFQLAKYNWTTFIFCFETIQNCRWLVVTPVGQQHRQKGVQFTTLILKSGRCLNWTLRPKT